MPHAAHIAEPWLPPLWGFIVLYDATGRKESLVVAATDRRGLTSDLRNPRVAPLPLYNGTGEEGVGISIMPILKEGKMMELPLLSKECMHVVYRTVLTRPMGESFGTQ